MADDGGAILCNLPSDMKDLVAHNLPAASIARLRLVSKEWHRVFTDPAFLHSHVRHQVPKPLFLFIRDFELYPRGPDEDLYRFNTSLHAIDARSSTSRPVIQFGEILPASYDPEQLHRLLQIEGSCDGVVLASYDGMLYAYNPLTRFWAWLPSLHTYTGGGGGVVGFYTYQPPAADEGAEEQFRVLYQTGCPGNAVYWVYTLGSGDERCIHRPSEKADIDPLLASGIAVACQKAPALVNGCLHWIREDNLANQLVVFDTRAEMFRWMNAPALDPQRCSNSCQLFNMDGMLTLSSINTATVDVWNVPCYASRKWVWMYRIELPVTVIDHFCGGVAPVIHVLPDERQVLVQCMQSLLQCDNSRILKIFELPNHRPVILPHTMKESLLTHRFLDKQEKDASYLHPPFFHPLCV